MPTMREEMSYRRSAGIGPDRPADRAPLRREGRGQRAAGDVRGECQAPPREAPPPAPGRVVLLLRRARRLAQAFGGPLRTPGARAVGRRNEGKQMTRKRKSAFLRAIERKREATRQQPGEANEPEAGEATPPSRVLRERPAPLFPAKNPAARGSEETSMNVDLRALNLESKYPRLAALQAEIGDLEKRLHRARGTVHQAQGQLGPQPVRRVVRGT